MLTSYHVHSNLSDGTADMEQMVLAGIGAGLEEVGVSDHFLMLADSETRDWSMPLDYLPRYVQRLLELKEKYRRDITVRLGLEADYQPATVDILSELLPKYPFDYVIGSVHIVEGFPIDDTPEYWEQISQSQRDLVIGKYWDWVKQMAVSRVFDIVGHIDLHKKFNFVSETDISDKIESALNAISQSDMTVELNTSGWNRPVRQQYPSREILSACAAKQIPVIITADAHQPEHISRDYDSAKKLLESISGYTDIGYELRQRRVLSS